MEYVLVFKNGYQLTVTVDDSKKFLSAMFERMVIDPGIPSHLYCNREVMVQLDQLVIAHPKIMANQALNLTADKTPTSS